MSRELLRQAFDALNLINHRGNTDDELLIVGRAMTDIKERLANPEPEPVADTEKSELAKPEPDVVYRLKEQIKELQERRDGFYDEMLRWRDIDRQCGDAPCPACGGSGIKSYSDTTTWRGGFGGQAFTNDVCDKCWGSGNNNKPWANLRKLIAKPDLEPVADMKRLSDDELDELHFQNPDDPIAFARAVETALLEKNK